MALGRSSPTLRAASSLRSCSPSGNRPGRASRRDSPASSSRAAIFSRMPGAAARARSAGVSSIRAMSPWWRTRSWPKPRRAEIILGRPDLLQALDLDRGLVGKARGQAGQRRLVPGRQAEMPGQRPDLLLGQPGLLERRADAQLPAGLGARAGNRPGRRRSGRPGRRGSPPRRAIALSVEKSSCLQ